MNPSRALLEDYASSHSGEKMKTTKILFNRESAIAYRQGRKCRTQRVINPQPEDGMVFGGVILESTDKKVRRGDCFFYAGDLPMVERQIHIRCPYGQPGDRLQLLTGWAVPKEYDDHKPSDLLGSNLHCEDIWTYFDSDQKPECIGRLRSPLFMPGWLRDVMPHPKIISIEARRLHEIAEDECIEEGVFPIPSNSPSRLKIPSSPYMEEYANVWNLINAKRGYPWESNPWVWNIEMEKWHDACKET